MACPVNMSTNYGGSQRATAESLYFAQYATYQQQVWDNNHNPHRGGVVASSITDCCGCDARIVLAGILHVGIGGAFIATGVLTHTTALVVIGPVYLCMPALALVACKVHNCVLYSTNRSSYQSV